jgi:hypothetical protein
MSTIICCYHKKQIQPIFCILLCVSLHKMVNIQHNINKYEYKEHNYCHKPLWIRILFTGEKLYPNNDKNYWLFGHYPSSSYFVSQYNVSNIRFILRRQAKTPNQLGPTERDGFSPGNNTSCSIKFYSWLAKKETISIKVLRSIVLISMLKTRLFNVHDAVQF